MPAVTTAPSAVLSPRQRWILGKVAGGSTRRAIAAELHVAPSTVTGYLADIYAALGVAGAPQAVAVAHRLGLLPGSAPAVPQGGPLGAGDAGVALELGREKFPQGAITLRAAGKSIGRERSSLALEHGARRGQESIDGHLVGIVVASSEIVFGRSRPFQRWWRQSRSQQRRKVEHS